ncbi:MAG: DinB family protein [Chloroflexia bacterium]|nr:DinB family protein [Chloroflexia bacterium]
MFTHAPKAKMTAAHDEGAPGDQPPAAGNAGDSHRANDGREVMTVDEEGRTTDAVIATLASVPVDLGRLIEGKSAEDLARPAQDGGWGLVEILPHFRDWEEIIGNRVAAILVEDEPAFEEYDDSLWAIEHGYRDQDTRAAFEEFAERRGALVERLGALGADEWNRVGILPKRGRVTLHWLLNSVCNHDASHVVQARDVLA